MSSPYPPHPRPPANEDLLGWASLGHWIGFTLRAPFRHRRLALASFLAVFSLAITAAIIVPPKYQVQATLLARPTGGQTAEQPGHDAREVVLRRDNIEALVRRTHLVDLYLEGRPRGVRLKDWVFQTVLGRHRDRESLEESLVESLQGQFQIWNTPENVVYFTFSWWSPEIATVVVDGALQSFIDSRHSLEIKSRSDAAAILEKHQGLLEQAVADAIERLEQKEKDLKTKARPIVPTAAPGPVASSADTEVTRLRSELLARKRTIADLQQYRQARITELQAELAKQTATYTPDHPIVQSTRRMLDGLASPSEREEDLRSEVEELQAKIVARGGKVPGTPTGLAADPIAQARERLDRIDSRLELERQNLASLLDDYGRVHSRIVGARIDIETAEAAFKERFAIIQPPTPPRGPIKPYALFFTLGGLLGGVALAFFVSVAADLWKGVVQETWQLESDLQLPVLAVVRRDTVSRPAPPPAS